MGRKVERARRRPPTCQLAGPHSPPPLRLSDLPFPLPLALSLPLLFDFIK